MVSPLIDIWHEWDATDAAESADPTDPSAEEEVCFYDAGTWGPQAADRLIEHDGRRWRRL